MAVEIGEADRKPALRLAVPAPLCRSPEVSLCLLYTSTVKLALKGLALNMAAELRPHGVAAVAVTPGFLRSETMLERFGVTEENWREGGNKDGNFLESESPLFVGRAVVALSLIHI